MQARIYKYTFIGLLVFTVGAFMAFYAYAQGPEQGYQGPSEEELRREEPSQGDIDAFEKESGGAPNVPSGDLDAPSADDVGSISEEAKAAVPAKDLVAIVCATTRWKSGGFFAAMDAVNRHVVPGLEKVKALGVAVEFPDTDALKAEGTKKLDMLCQAATASEAETHAKAFRTWALREGFEPFKAVRKAIMDGTKEKGEALRARVKTAVDAFVAAERPKIEGELKAEAERLASAKRAELEAAQNPNVNVDAIKAEMRAAMDGKVRARKADMQQRMKALIEETAGADKAALEDIGKAFQGVEGRIAEAVRVSEAQYTQYRDQAFTLRAAAMLAVVDANAEKGLAALTARSGELDAAHANDAAIPTVAEIRAEYTRDRAALKAALDAAVRAGDEGALEKALADFRTKWEGYRTRLERAGAQSLTAACAGVVGQFASSKPRMASGVARLRALQSSCAADANAAGCAEVRTLEREVAELRSRLEALQEDVTRVEALCADAANAKREALSALLSGIRTKADAARNAGEALDAKRRAATLAEPIAR